MSIKIYDGQCLRGSISVSDIHDWQQQLIERMMQLGYYQAAHQCANEVQEVYATLGSRVCNWEYQNQIKKLAQPLPSLWVHLLQQEADFEADFEKVEPQDQQEWVRRRMERLQERLPIESVLSEVSQQFANVQKSNPDHWCSQMHAKVRLYPMSGKVLLLPQCGSVLSASLQMLLEQKPMDAQQAVDFDAFWTHAKALPMDEQLKQTTRYVIFEQRFKNPKTASELLEGLDPKMATQEYGYWNNSDAPDGISSASWKTRKKNWEKALCAGVHHYDAPGIEVSLFDASQLRYTVRPDDVLWVMQKNEYKRAISESMAKALLRGIWLDEQKVSIEPGNMVRLLFGFADQLKEDGALQARWKKYSAIFESLVPDISCAPWDQQPKDWTAQFVQAVQSAAQCCLLDANLGPQSPKRTPKRTPGL